MPPREKRNEYKQYDPKNLPMRSHSQFKKQIRQLDKTNSSKDRHDLESEFGWAYFVKAVRLCQKLTLTSQELSEIQFLFQSFYNYYE
ncbi:8537_t:CDS:2, partial [Funneliformis geosporum]